MTIQVLQQAEQLFRAGRRRAAIDLLEEHMAESPGDRQAASVLGRIYVNNSQPDRAAFWLKHALQIDRKVGATPTSPDIKRADSDSFLNQDDLEFMSASNHEAEECNFSDEYGLRSERLNEVSDDVVEGDGAESNQTPSPVLVDVPVVHPVAQSEPAGLDPQEKQDTAAKSGYFEDFDDLDFGDELEVVVETPAAANVQADIDWQEYALDEDLIDTADEDPVEDVTVSRLSILDRARQVAARLAAEADWSKREIPVLVEVLAVHKSHGKTIAALKRLLLEDQVTPAELAIMHDLRLKWGGGGYNRDYRFNEATDGWPNLSWRQALRLLRCLNVDNADELMLFVDDCFDDWCRDEGLLQAYPKFVYYLDRVIESANDTAFITAESVAPYVDYSLFPDEDGYYDTWRVNGTRLPHHLQVEGLIWDQEIMQ